MARAASQSSTTQICRSWQGQTHAPAPCLCRGPEGGDDRAGDSSWQVKHEEQINLDKCRKIHATETDPCGLGIMHPEGRSQLKRTWKMSPGSVDEVELVQLKPCVEGMAPHEPPGP